jgi:PKD repeat protein
VDTLKPWHYAQAIGGYVNYVVLKLIDEGSLSMDDSIGMHMDAASMGLDGSITVRQLIRHNTALKEMWNNNPVSTCFQDIWINNPSVMGCPGDILNCLDPALPNPVAYDNNNTNMYVLGYLIDSVTGNSYETEIQNRIFNPFGMTNTYISGCDTVTIDSINGIWTTNSGYANNMSYLRYFSTSGPNRGLISKSEHVARFYRSLFQGNLLSASVMDSIRKIIPASEQNLGALGNYACVANTTIFAGYNTDITRIIFNSGDTVFLYGKGGNGMNGSYTVHWPEKDWTLSLVQNDRSVVIPSQFHLSLDLLCYLNGIDSVAVPVTQLPVADFNFVQDSNLTYSFTDASTNNPDSWSWEFGDGNSSGDQNPVHTYASDGQYNVRLIVSNSAGSDTVEKSVTVTVINDIITAGAKIYPNPFMDEITFDFSAYDGMPEEVIIYNIQGLIVDRILPVNSKVLHWDASGQKQGVYFYRIIDEGNIFNGRLIKQ